MAQRIPLPLTVSCFSKIQIGFTFLVPAHLGSPGQRAIKRVLNGCTCGQVRSLVLSFYVSLWHSVLVCYQCVEIFGQTSSKYLWVGFRSMGVGLALGLRLVLHMIDMIKAPHKYLDV